jgi:hypothetical protein
VTPEKSGPGDVNREYHWDTFVKAVGFVALPYFQLSLLLLNLNLELSVLVHLHMRHLVSL